MSTTINVSIQLPKHLSRQFNINSNSDPVAIMKIPRLQFIIDEVI